MSFEPNKIYLHDPHGYFEEGNWHENNTVQWSEDRIDENDYEYIRYNRLSSDEWHDINKELPEEGQECLVYYDNKEYDIKIYYGNDKFKYWDEVVAWKILIPPVI